MGYAILTQAQLNSLDLNNIRVDGKLINCSPRANVAGDLFIIEGDQFSQYTRNEIFQLIQENWSDWNVEL